MKKLLGIILTVCMICSAFTTPAFADSAIKVTIDGKLVDCAAYGQEPLAIDGRTMVPLRSVFEALGATVLWDGETQSVLSTRGDDMIVLKLNSADMIVNDEVKKLDVPAQSMNERTMVPVRAIAEAFGCDVKWDGATMTVIVTTTSSEQATPEMTVSNLYKAINTLDIEKGISYFKDEDTAFMYFGAKNAKDYITIVGGMDNSDERMNAIIVDYFAECMKTCTVSVDTVTVNGNTAVVTTTAVMPDFDNLNDDAFYNIPEEQTIILLEKALEKCGVTMEEMATTADPALQAEFEYAIMEVSFEYAAQLIIEDAKNGNMKTINETITLENVDGKWFIVEMN